MHPSISVIHNSGLSLSRKLVGFVSRAACDNIFFYNNSLSVLLRALNERLYYVKGVDGFVPCPEPLPNVFDTLKPIKRQLLRRLPWKPTRWSIQQFVDSYSGSKRKRYESAASTYLRTGMRRSYGFWKTFIKAELYNGSKKSNPCPRLIQPRHPIYNLVVGSYLRPAEKCLYLGVDSLYGHKVVLKCDAPWTRAQLLRTYWNEFDNPVFVGMDASRFDQHVSSDALKFEHSIYNAIFNSPELAELLEWQIHNVGYFNNKHDTVKYTVEGKRGSGDMNTALGNVLLMTLITYHYLESLHVKYRFINDGDDCGVIIESSNLPLLRTLPEHHLRYGFEMEVEAAVDGFEHIEFCQSRPVYLGSNRWTMVRNVHKALAHDLLFIDRDWATAEEVAAATGLGGLALYQGVPVLGEFYAMMSRSSKRNARVERLLGELGGHLYAARVVKAADRPESTDYDATRVSFYHAFGVLPDVQEHLETKFRETRSLSEIDQIAYALHTDPRLKEQYYVQRHH